MTTTDEARKLITARYVIPVPGQVYEKHYVEVQAGRITGIRRFRDVDTTGNVEVYDLGNAVLVPGLVNAFTQLDFCHLRGRVPYTGSFTSWLQTAFAAHHAASADEVQRGIKLGLNEAIRGGTTSIGDVTITDASVDPISSSRLRGVVYLDLSNLDPALADTELKRLEHRVEQVLTREVATSTTGDRPILLVGIAPHAPYAASDELYRRAMHFSAARGDRVLTRLAETEDEGRLIQVIEGDFVPFLEHMYPEGVPPIRAAASPVAWLADLVRNADVTGPARTQALRIARPPAIVHAHYLDVDDMLTIGRMRAPIVFCPRHHDTFEHPKAPIEDLLGRALTVGLGTASLATAESVSILDEMRYLARHPEYAISREEILRMGTLYGARALGIEDEVGVLAPGMQADLTAVRIPRGVREEQVLPAMLHEDGPVAFSMVAGQPIVNAGTE